MVSEREYRKSEASRLLGEPQHRLIYLCEKGVVVPDFGQAAGRGSSRRFSPRNLLEFALALRLRELMLPVVFVKAVIYLLREFERRVRRDIRGFRVPESLSEVGTPEVEVVVVDGPRLYFRLSPVTGGPHVFGGVGLSQLISPAPELGDRSNNRTGAGYPFGSTGLTKVGGSLLESESAIRSEQLMLTINLSRLARNLRLDG